VKEHRRYLQSFNKQVAAGHVKSPTNNLGIKSILQDRIHSEQGRIEVYAQITITK
jgi:hypothetical protein